MGDRAVVDTIRARLADRGVRPLLADLGRLDGAVPLGGGAYLMRCVWHADRTPSNAVAVRQRSIVGYCHGACQRGGDVFDIIAGVHGLTLPRDFGDVVKVAAQLAGVSLDPRRPLPAPPPPPPPPPPRTYPPSDEVLSTWTSCTLVGDDPAAVAWCRRLTRKGREELDLPRVVADLEDRDLVRAVPIEARLPRWARYQGRTWAKTGHRMLAPVFDAKGTMRSLRAIRIEGPEDTPKRLPAAGHLAAGLVLADPLARLILRGEERGAWPDPLRIIVAEGEPDFLTWAVRYSDADEDAPAVFGVLSGGWTQAHADRIPDGAEVVIDTDHDRAGDGYAAEVIATFADRCKVRRSTRGAV